MSLRECDIWESILRKAVDFAMKVSQTRHAVVSRFIELLGDVKVASYALSLVFTSHPKTERNRLKPMPRLLQSLLNQSLPASCSELNAKLLCLVDQALVPCYNSTVEDRACALTILRSIGNVISRSKESEIVQFLSTLQQGVSCWIADEEEALAENEHRELVCPLFFDHFPSTNLNIILPTGGYTIYEISGPSGSCRTFNRNSQSCLDFCPIRFRAYSWRGAACLSQLLADDISYASGYTQERLPCSDSSSSPGVERLPRG